MYRNLKKKSLIKQLFTDLNPKKKFMFMHCKIFTKMKMHINLKNKKTQKEKKTVKRN